MSQRVDELITFQSDGRNKLLACILNLNEILQKADRIFDEDSFTKQLCHAIAANDVDLIIDLTIKSKEAAKKIDLLINGDAPQQLVPNHGTEDVLRDERPRRNAFKKATVKVNEQLNLPLNTKLRREGTSSVVVKSEKTSSSLSQIEIKQEAMEMPPPRAIPKRGRKKKLTIDKASNSQSVPDVDLTVSGESDCSDRPQEQFPAVDHIAEKTRKRKISKPIVKVERLSNDVLVQHSLPKVIDNVHPEECSQKKLTSPIKQPTRMSRTIVKVRKISLEKLKNAQLVDPAEEQENNANVANTAATEDSMRRGRGLRTRKTRTIDAQQPIEQSGKSSVYEDAISTLTENLPKELDLIKNNDKVCTNTNATFVMDKIPLASSTFVIPNQEPLNIDNIMTDDDSVPESDVQWQSKIPKSVPHKPLFNPCVSTPVKKKVEAFEKFGGLLAKNEDDARKKKQALIAAQTEERRRKRQEREEQARMKREALEEKKQRALKEREKVREMNKKRREEVQKLEQLKQKEKDIKRQEDERKRQEDDRRRQEAEEQMKQQEQAAMERMLHEERLKRHEQRRAQNQPIYMIKKAPLLPVPDPYDSDGANYVKPVKPSWQRSEKLVRCLNACNEKLLSEDLFVFVAEEQAPNLKEIFPNVHPSKLHRRSSAIWKKPARFTMMDSIIEANE